MLSDEQIMQLAYNHGLSYAPSIDEPIDLDSEVIAFARSIESAAQGWRDIASAPRDGTEILVYRPLAYKTNDPVITIAIAESENRWCWPETVPEGCEPCNPTSRACHCTHWMPLPPAPAEQEK